MVSVLGCSSIIFFITLGKSLNTCVSFKPKPGAKCWNLPVNSAFFTDLRSCLSKKEIARWINIMCSGINSLQKFHVRYNGIKLPILIQVHSWFKKRRCCLNIKKRFWEVLTCLHDSYILNEVLIFAIQWKWRDKILLFNYRIIQKGAELFQSFPFPSYNQHQSYNTPQTVGCKLISFSAPNHLGGVLSDPPGQTLSCGTNSVKILVIKVSPRAWFPIPCLLLHYTRNLQFSL